MAGGLKIAVRLVVLSKPLFAPSRRRHLQHPMKDERSILYRTLTDWNTRAHLIHDTLINIYSYTNLILIKNIILFKVPMQLVSSNHGPVSGKVLLQPS